MATKEVAKGDAQQRGSRCPGTALQHFVVPIEPGVRVLRVRKGLEARIAAERAARPFPEVSRHILAAVSAGAAREIPHRSRAPNMIIVVRKGPGWGLVAPAETSLMLTPRVPPGSFLPFSFTRQALFYRLRVGFCFVPT